MLPELQGHLVCYIIQNAFVERTDMFLLWTGRNFYASFNCFVELEEGDILRLFFKGKSAAGPAVRDQIVIFSKPLHYFSHMMPACSSQLGNLQNIDGWR